MALSITILTHYAECLCTESRIIFIAVLNVLMLSVVTLNVIMMNVMALDVWEPSLKWCLQWNSALLLSVPMSLQRGALKRQTEEFFGTNNILALATLGRCNTNEIDS